MARISAAWSPMPKRAAMSMSIISRPRGGEMSVLGPQAVVHQAGEGEANHAFLTRRFRLMPEDTGGTFALWEEEIPEGVGPPLHVHHDAQELFVVLEGRVRFRCSGRETEAGPGASVLIPQHA